MEGPDFSRLVGNKEKQPHMHMLFVQNLVLIHPVNWTDLDVTDLLICTIK
jgi:hypothetical protein